MSPPETEAMDALANGVMILDREYRYVFVNREAERFLDQTREELIGRSYWDRFQPERGTVMDREYRRAFATGDRVQFRYFHPSWRSWFNMTAKIDSADRLVVSMADTTDICRLQFVLDSLEHKLCEAFQNAAIGVTVTDDHGRFLDANEAFVAITGYSQDELRRRDFLSITHPDDREEHAKARAQVLGRGNQTAVFEHRCLRKDRDIVWVRNNMSVLMRPERQTKRFIVLCEEITEAKAAEQRLRASERRFRSLIERSHDLISITSGDGLIAYSSPALESILGYKPDELAGTNMFELIHPEDLDVVLSGMSELCRDRDPGRSLKLVYRILHRNESWRYMESIAANLSDDPAVGGIVANARDITETVEAQRKLKEATQMKSRFLANMSHEIRTPMNGVVGLSELLMDTPLTDDQKEYVEGIQYSGELLLRIIGDILDFSKIEAGKLEVDNVPYDLRSTLKSVSDAFLTQCNLKNLHFESRIAQNVPAEMQGDSIRLRQVLANLLGNAVKFTSAGTITLSASCANGVLRISVQDTGLGIPQDHQDKLFLAFTQADGSTTRQYGGTGLGLAISKQLVELMGGAIGFHSVAGRGSEFWFELPVSNRREVSEEGENTGIALPQPVGC